jgi:ribosomal RNA-processing protein 8
VRTRPMNLFEVPGWSVSPTVASAPGRGSRKRKRPGDSDTVRSIEVNPKRLVKALKTRSDHEAHISSKTTRRTNEKRQGNARSSGDAKGTRKEGNKPRKEGTTIPHSSIQKDVSKTPCPPVLSEAKQRDLSSLTPLQKGMKQSLDGARFRRAIRSPSTAADFEQLIELQMGK